MSFVRHPQPQVPSTQTNIDPSASTDPRTQTHARTNDAQSATQDSSSEPYPENKHAGAVGYGPNYHFGPTVGDKTGGLMEEMRGKVTGNHEKVQHGHDRRTGELRRREHEEDLSGSAFNQNERAHEGPGDSEKTRAAASGPHNVGVDNVERQKQIG